MKYEERSLEAARRRMGDCLSRRMWSLQSGSLCEEARRRTGLRDFGDPPIEPALSILVNSLENEADLHPLGRFLMRAHLRELLQTRLRLTQAWRARSEALDVSRIQRPVFITGMPRSGSTFLHELLAEDGQNRVASSLGGDVSYSGP
jgi:Sulfotransferase family